MASAVLDKTKIATGEGNITVYNFSAQTGEYTGSSNEYLTVGIGLPAHSTDIDPGVSANGYVPVFVGNKWEQKEDHRGTTVWSTSDRAASVIDYIGAIKDGFVTVAPATQYDEWDGRKWVTDSVAQRTAEVAAAELYAQRLVDTVMQSISVIQLKLQAGRTLTDVETRKLNAVLDYIDAVNAVDTTTAPDINWPDLAM
ncbi:Phage tail fiber assembly protein [Kosakonia radicincitans]|uniref:tail fiber assembly protein n=1 Tax=Kosakonia radicincitans TaxID=283686 RepID=UPI001183A4D2|nr:tail fiber assembly protein [Kosakonia radicincitans]VVT53796.1 Phage tail fiber assembly protein [Kosakonia radicincitans]